MQHVAFYTFVRVDDPVGVARQVSDLCAGLLGNVLLASEGINGMLAGQPHELDAFFEALSSDSVNSGRFTDLVSKRSACDRPPFKKLKVKAKSEIVPLGVDDFDPVPRVAEIKAADVPPQQWRELLDDPSVVVLDNRNHFEYQVGRFRGATDPGVTNFRDFAAYVQEHAPTWRAEGKKVAMYCTGGIRCEKSSAWMQDMGLTVHQLEGGILNYFMTMPDAAADFDGECFVFDDRVTLDTSMQDTGKTLADIPGQFDDPT